MTSLLILKVEKDAAATYYRLTRLTPADGYTQAAWRLVKPNGVQYTCHVDEFGYHCTCRDAIYRRQNSPEPCKHVIALQQQGLL